MIALLCLLSGAHADSFDDPYEALRLRVSRAAAVDQLQGRPDTRLADAWRWREALEAPPGWAPGLDADLETLAGWMAIERQAWSTDGMTPVWVVRPDVWLSAGSAEPIYFDGHDEPGLLSAVASVDGSLYAGPLEARLRLRGDLDLAPTSGGGALEQFRLGARTGGFTFALSQEARRYGPARHHGLILTDNGRPLPALELHGEGRLPGGFDVLGRFSGDLLVGAIPDQRADVNWPLWLLMDLRWQPVPYVELGVTRNAMFGGVDDGVARPIDWGQLVFPSQPHIYGDTERILYDSDERIGIDLRGTIPVRRIADALGGNLPIDYVELYLQHGAEDTAADSFTLKLSGAANVYGAEIGAGPVVATLEAAVVEDDYQRWYVGHRLYHIGWTTDDHVLGHAWGGDARSVFAQAGVVGLGRLTLLGSYEYAHQWHVADLVQDTLFVFPTDQERHIGRVRAAWRTDAAGWFGVDASAGPYTGDGFIPGQDGVSWRAMARWSVGDALFSR